MVCFAFGIQYLLANSSESDSRLVLETIGKTSAKADFVREANEYREI
jgi:hypothetical protein